MLAMNYRGPQRVRIDHKPMPEILHPQYAIVRVTRSWVGLSPSEYSTYLRRFERADERTRTAYPCSSYECAVTYAAVCRPVRKRRTNKRNLRFRRE